MDRKKQLGLNPRFLFWARALTEFKALNAIIVLFFIHRGVSME